MAETTNPWTAIFGEHLKNPSGGDVDPATFSDKKGGVILYFSAHWAKPAVKLAPEIVNYYTTYHERFDFEIVFISVDKTEAGFNEHKKNMPFLSLPYASKSKENIFKMFKVKGIPSLVVLDNSGKTICASALGKVMEDPEGFPWRPVPYDKIMVGNVKNGKGEDVSIDSLKSNTAIGIYFSAHWCPPCRQFTPELIKTYNKLKAEGTKFEIIFASSDNDPDQYKEYFAEMPWLSFAYSDKRTRDLSDLFAFQGIPTLVIIDPSTGKIINKEGRFAVASDPKGEEFPWIPKSVSSISNAGPDINDQACFIYLNSQLTDSIKSKLTKACDPYFKQWQEEGEQKLKFFFGSKEPMGARVKEFLKVDTMDPVLVIIDLQQNKKDIYPTPVEPTEEDFKNVIEKWLAKNKE